MTKFAASYLVGAAVLVLVLTSGAARVMAQDANSLRAVKDAGGVDVALGWEDATPSAYCIRRAGIAPAGQ